MAQKEDIESQWSVHSVDSDNELPRKRTFTAKGRMFTYEVKAKSLRRLCGRLLKVETVLQTLLNQDKENAEYEQVRSYYREWLNIFEEVLQEKDSCFSVLQTFESVPSEYAQQFSKLEDTITNSQKVKERVDKWLQDREGDRQMAAKQQDQRSRRSYHSASRTGTSVSHVSSARLKEEQKKVELRARQATLEERYEIEIQKIRLKLEEEKLQLRTEMAISDAKCKVFETFEVEEEKNIQQSAVDIQNIVQQTANLDIEPIDNVVIPNNVGHEPLGMNKEAMVSVPDKQLPSVVQQLRKPVSDIVVFSGNPFDYHKFMRQFKTKILANTSDPDECLSYLEQYTSGEARDIVNSYSYMDAEQGYFAAMDELKERYGDEEIIISAFMEKALEWTPIKSDDVRGFDKFAVFLSECENAVNNDILNNKENIKRLVMKLPYSYQEKFRSLVQGIRDSRRTLQFSDLTTFMKKEARKATDPMFGKDALRNKHDKGKTIKTSQPKVKLSLATEVKSHRYAKVKSSFTQTSERLAESKLCFFCETSSHPLNDCEKFKALSYEEKTQLVKGKGLCFRCLKCGHRSKDCKGNVTCSRCQRPHNVLFHLDQTPDCRTPVSALSSLLRFDTGVGDEDECTMVIMPVKVRMANGLQSIETYAFLDPGSSASFCTTELMRKLGATGKQIKINIDSMGAPRTTDTYAVSGMIACNLTDGNHVTLPKLYAVDRLPVSKSHIPKMRDIEEWPHLSDLKIPEVDAPIGLMIGNNVADAYTPIEVRTGPDHAPHATKTRLGWALWNVTRHVANACIQTRPVTVNRTDITVIQESENLRSLDHLVRQSFNVDFPERIIEDVKQMSQEDKAFMTRVDESIQVKDGHYEIALPFRNKDVQLPNNYQHAFRRLMGLKGKMERNKQFHQEYTTFMNKVIQKGYAEVVPSDDPDPLGHTWYIPHHGVYHPKKLKLRVVFDCAATYEGVSLNSQLLPGPNLTNNLIGVLIRFRQEKCAVTGDIESMFYQVRVPEYHWNYQRFLWWPNGDYAQAPVKYRMKVHMFGTTSSPSCANVALLRTVSDNEKDFDPVIAEKIRKNFYVDDCLTSTNDEKEAVNIVSQVSTMCERGGFKLTKWSSNSDEVLKCISPDNRAEGSKDLSIDKSTVGVTERALGVTWWIHADALGFTVNARSVDCTRRNILSVVSSVFDPLGLVSPFILKAKLLLQELCCLRTGWDERITGTQLGVWQRWISELPSLANISVPRCYKPADLQAVRCCQLHVFSDASNLGYGVVAYLRFTSESNIIHCTLIMSKARVAPLKKVTIPRLELTAACVAVKLAHVMRKELHYSLSQTFFWTDSMSVLRYLANETSRFKTFVANRITVIRDGSDMKQWSYVPSHLNPADAASRGLNIDAFTNMKEWFAGPCFLSKPENEWPSETVKAESIEDDPEIKRIVNSTVTSKDVDSLEKLLCYGSTWLKVKRIVSWYLLFKDTLRDSVQRKKTVKELQGKLQQKVGSAITKAKQPTYLTSEVLQRAELAIVQYVQKKHFSDVLHFLQGYCQTPKLQTSVRKLDPILVNGVIRVGGRLSEAFIPSEAKHPILLPKNSCVSQLIIEDAHRKVGHMGRAAILTHVRQQYWILGSGYLIRNALSRCVLCRKYTARQREQKMADLPIDRLVPDEPPFSTVGVDFFGPFMVKRGRASLKRYGVVFTCLRSRAVHLEVASSLDTSSCINAFRRFFARRGHPKKVRSDNGTNLVGCERELKEDIQKWNKQQIHNAFIQQQITWEFSPPSGSHHGGVWERMIRTIRKILYSLLHEQVIHLDDEGLQTLFCEVEAIINMRPITTVSNDITDLTPLTPNHILMLNGQPQLPPGYFSKDDCYVRRKWRQIQYLADTFWKRWSKEYVTTLQERQKWTCPRRNVAVNDIVLVLDNLPRNAWCLGRVMEVFPDKKGYVRIVKVKTQNTELQRPVSKLCIIVESDSADT